MESAFSHVRWEPEEEAEEASLLCHRREFIPEEKKDSIYWENRCKNNEAARRSREKRRINDYVLEKRLVSMSKENARLRVELLSLKLLYGLLSNEVSYSSSQRALSQLHPLAPKPLVFCPDKDLYWGGRQDRDSSNMSGNQQPPVGLGTHPGSAFRPTHPIGLKRNYPFSLDIHSLHSPMTTPLLLTPHLALPAPWAGRPLLQPGNQRIFSDEEGKQMVLADSSTALPHKLRLKTQNSQYKNNGSKSTSPIPVYMTD
ncbi:nuclear factor interleukin-3-regulated protein-like [Xyrauchen texanus]|uniref:nuclear factor interleukin-3-regulated protein-like n=1 Tax=Xyrauchen texanus TaxID=154827 RepID=UPI0022421BC2|nr:nuclear factor interleukin-3-regulated protein-like [Xyrauchen texanus]